MYQSSAMAIGVLISFMLMANGALQIAFGASLSLLILHAVGTMTLIVILIIKRAPVVISDRIPLYLFSSGAFGVLLVFFNNKTVASIGLTLTIALGVIGQLIVSSAIDHYGWFGLKKHPGNIRKIAGFMLILAGIAVMAWPRG